AVTGRGGVHFYFAAPPDAGIGCSTDLLGYGIDVRAEGGYVVAPPSPSVAGRYRWSEYGRPWDAVLPEPSPGLVDALRPPPLVAAPARVPAYGGNARVRLAALLDAVLTAPVGERN